MGIFEDIRSSTDGIIGSFITTESGEVAASDVPALFKDELENASESLFYLADIVQESKDFESLLIEAQDGHISWCHCIKQCKPASSEYRYQKGRSKS